MFSFQQIIHQWLVIASVLCLAGHPLELAWVGRLWPWNNQPFRAWAAPSAEAPANGTWHPTGSLNRARRWHTATLLTNGLVLVVGGERGSFGYLASAELYDPATGTWRYTGSMTTLRAWHTATLLPNGQVLVAGGYNGAYLTSAEFV